MHVGLVTGQDPLDEFQRQIPDGGRQEPCASERKRSSPSSVWAQPSGGVKKFFLLLAVHGLNLVIQKRCALVTLSK
jgi:hypothetical protein